MSVEFDPAKNCIISKMKNFERNGMKDNGGLNQELFKILPCGVQESHFSGAKATLHLHMTICLIVRSSESKTSFILHLLTFILHFATFKLFVIIFLIQPQFHTYSHNSKMINILHFHKNTQLYNDDNRTYWCTSMIPCLPTVLDSCSTYLPQDNCWCTNLLGSSCEISFKIRILDR